MCNFAHTQTNAEPNLQQGEHMFERILLCGNDASLLETREALLKHAKFQVHSAHLLVARDLEVDLAVLCHTLTARERRAVKGAFREHNPAARVLTLLKESATRNEVEGESFCTNEGPAALIECARHMMLIKEPNLK